ncbi:MAG: phage holin family protein [Deinococcota bacterium]|jgi:hypothetical protein|nr:phage holin family protein [Deinococcota bacterium]
MATHRDDPPQPPKVTVTEGVTPSQGAGQGASRSEQTPVAPRVTTAAEPAGERSLGELFADLSQGLSTLLSQEVALAKAEVSQTISQITKSIIPIAIGGVLAFGGYLALIATLIIGLAYLIPIIWSALIVTLVLLVVGGVLISKGVNDLKKTNPVPEKTIASLKEDTEWAKEQLK